MRRSDSHASPQPRRRSLLRPALALIPLAVLCLGCAGWVGSPDPVFPLADLVGAAPGRDTWEAMRRPDWGEPTLETFRERSVCKVAVPHDDRDVVVELRFSTRDDAPDPSRPCDLLLEHTLLGDDPEEAEAAREQLSGLVELSDCPEWLKTPGTEHQSLQCGRRTYDDGPTTYVRIRNDRRGWEVSHTVEWADLDD